MSPIWTSTSQFYSIEDVGISAKSNISQSSDGVENEPTNKNLSKVRSYLRRCENAINSLNLGGKRSTMLSSSSSPSSAEVSTNNAVRTRQSTSSWYIDELGSECNESNNEFYYDNALKVNEIMEPTIYSIPDDDPSKANHQISNDRVQKANNLPTLLLVSKSRNRSCWRSQNRYGR